MWCTEVSIQTLLLHTQVTCYNGNLNIGQYRTFTAITPKNHCPY